MTLSNSYVQAYKRIPNLLAKIRDGQAPPRLTIQLLKDWGFKSNNDRPFIPLLKSIGFLTSDGVPTQLYNDYRDHSRSGKILGKALKDAYHDIFLITALPNASDMSAVQGKFRSYHNVSDNVAGLMAKTFFALLGQADLDDSISGNDQKEQTTDTNATIDSATIDGSESTILNSLVQPSLHYNIQIHLPPTKDVEVYNAIFKSLKEHLFAK